MDPAKVTARRTLDTPAVLPGGWRLDSLAELGERCFSDVMLAAAEGDPHDTSTVESALDDLHELVDAAGPAFDPTSWFVAGDGAGTLGVVLPQPFWDHPTSGTLFYLGIVPERRGVGLGRRLHALGLGLLHDRGVREYLGSTDPANTAMVRIFQANGCRVTRPGA